MDMFLKALRLIVIVGAVLGGLRPVSLSAAPAGQVPPPAVTVREERGTYFVTARFDIAAPPQAIHAVLTDYEAIPRFMPDISSSIVVERTAERTVVEQEAITRVLMFSKRVHIVLAVSEEQNTIRFHDRCGKSFARYEGMWRLIDQGGHTEAVYELIAKPGFSVPAFVLKRVLERNAVQMIEQLRGEVTLRAVR
jgi:carbon monoxide dehydrogenase subunit G